MDILEARFGEVIWLLNQLVFSNTAQRLAQVLLQRRRLEEDDTLTVTHEALSRDLGTAREMVTRLLDRFQQDGMVALSRGNIRILDEKRLQEL
ncbi:MAG: helix-turn-helix domain-containing protein [Oscillospiraceae bacterium]